MTDDGETARAFKTAWFSKAASKARIENDELYEAVREAIKGQADDLGGGVFKKRLNRKYASEHHSRKRRSILDLSILIRKE